LFWITDTQFLSEFNSGLFKNTTQWIAKYYAVCNGRMVVHTGDIVENTATVNGQPCSNASDYGNEWTSDPQWRAANQAMTVLLDANIPYTWDAGNHDGCHALGGANLENATDDGWIGWNYAAFNSSIVQKASLNWSNAAWVSSDNEGMDTAVSFSAAGQNFLLMNIQYNGMAELGWARQLLSNPSYEDYHAIIATHDFIGKFGWTDLPNFYGNLNCLIEGCNGQMGYPNVFLTLNGHYDNQSYHTRTTSAVLELMFDRQDEEDFNGSATVTILTFNVENGKIYVNTFDLNNPPQGKDSRPLTEPSYQFRLNQVFALTASCSHASVTVGSAITCKAKIEESGSAPTGSVIWSSNSTGKFSRASCRLTRGVCSVKFTPMATNSSVILTATYGGDSKNSPASGTYDLTVTTKATKTTVSCSPKSAVADTVTIITCKAKVKGYSPTGTVTWSQSGTGSVFLDSTTCTLFEGTCSMNMTGTAAGNVKIQGTYSGDSNNQGSSRLAKLTIKKAPTVTMISCTESSFGKGTNTTCTATVSGAYPSHNGTVTWSKVSGTGRVTFSSKTCTLASGTCSVTITATHRGRATIRAAYSGDSNNRKSPGRLVLTMA
jgi:hypothetical protein